MLAKCLGLPNWEIMIVRTMRNNLVTKIKLHDQDLALIVLYTRINAENMTIYHIGKALEYDFLEKL